MNRYEIIKEVSKCSGFTQKDITIVFDYIFDTITNELKKREDVSIPNFGKFCTWDVPAKKYVDLKTGVERVSEPSISVKFRPSSKLKERVNGTNI